MRVSYRDQDSEVTSEPYVPGPKVILYDHEGRALKRPIGFAPARPNGSIDKDRGPVVISRSRPNSPKRP